MAGKIVKRETSGSYNKKKNIVENETYNKSYKKDAKITRENKRGENGLHNKNFYTMNIILLAVLVGILHSYHVSSLFENSRHFSHLSTLEREMSFRTEMGMYYSYFKTMVESTSYFDGLNKLINNNHTEYPDTINTLQRFNLYPEVVLAGAYRIYTFVMDLLNTPIKDCWQVYRGENMPPIESCEGLGEPACFYVTSVFLFSGLTASIIFLYGLLLSNSVLGGLMSVLSFFYNHSESTRVQWTPPLRESFGYPLFLMQMFLVSYMLRCSHVTHKVFMGLVILTTAFMLCWQFASFVLVTQVLSMFILYLMKIISGMITKQYLHIIMISLLLNYVMMFFNPMLISSVLTTVLPAVYIILILDPYLPDIKKGITLILRIIIFLLTVVGVKVLTAGDKHDAHVWNLLKAKFTSYKDFHTLLYTCAAEFDFMEEQTPWRLTETLLLPVVIFSIIIVLFQVFRQIFSKSDKENGSANSAIVYNYIQMSAFTIMAILIMRLKLFFTPHLCICASLICSSKFFRLLSNKKITVTCLVALMSLMSVKGIQNLKSQWNIVGEYSNPQLEELIYWIRVNTPPTAVFAGPMPTMANLMLSTQRPVVNHPHYEDENLRQKTLKVYTLYSRKSVTEVYETLQKLQVEYAVLEESWCYRASHKGCAMLDLWDIQDQQNRGKTPFCEQIEVDPSPFEMVFQNSVYAVLHLRKNVD